MYRDPWIDLQPGGLILYADVNIGLSWERVGMLLVQDGASFRPAWVVYEDDVFELPEDGIVLEWASHIATFSEEVLERLVISGPLAGDAGLSEARFHPDRVELLMRATYAAPPSPDTGWQSLEPGVELRELDVAGEFGLERATLVRLDPAHVRFRVAYDPDVPVPLSAWAARAPCLLMINGGFFTPENEVIGVLVSGGQRWGSSLGSYAGMFAVTPADQVSVRSLTTWPFDPAESLAEAVQSFPVLVKPGGQMGFPADADDGMPARRTVVAQDRSGNVVVVVTPRGLLSLHELATFLAASDLTLNVALNLDGGASTGMWLVSGERVVEFDSLAPLPSVIVAERKAAAE
jgi:uncharacterized protein YigE (DUF2233 family)